MRVRTYLRVAKTKSGGVQVAATATPSHKPLMDPRGRPLPTAAFALDLELPDVMFKRAEQVLAEVRVDPAEVEIAADVANLRVESEGGNG